MESSGHAVAQAAVRDVAEPGARVVVVAGPQEQRWGRVRRSSILDGPERRSGSDQDASRSGRVRRDDAAARPRGIGAPTSLARTGTPCSGPITSARSNRLERVRILVLVRSRRGRDRRIDAERESAATFGNRLRRGGNDQRATRPSSPSTCPPDSTPMEANHAENRVEADRVVTFHDAETGVDDLAAEVTVADIIIPTAAERFVGGDIDLARPDGRAGRPYIIGGGPYTGAPALAAQAALRQRRTLLRRCARSVAGEIQGIARISSSNRTRATFSRPSGPRTSSRRPNSTTTWSCWAGARHRRRDPEAAGSSSSRTPVASSSTRTRSRSSPTRDRRHVGLYAQQTGTRKNGVDRTSTTGRRWPTRSKRSRPVGSHRARQRGGRTSSPTASRTRLSAAREPRG